MQAPTTLAAVAAFRTANEDVPDMRAAAVALIAAARACELGMREVMPGAAVDEFLSLVDAAGGLLVDHGGPLDFAVTRGSA